MQIKLKIDLFLIFLFIQDSFDNSEGEVNEVINDSSNVNFNNNQNVASDDHFSEGSTDSSGSFLSNDSDVSHSTSSAYSITDDDFLNNFEGNEDEFMNKKIYEGSNISVGVIWCSIYS